MLLNSNIAFLDISPVFPDSGDNVPIVAQVASFLSMIASLGSIVVGLLLVYKYQNQPEKGSTEVVSEKLYSSLSH